MFLQGLFYSHDKLATLQGGQPWKKCLAEMWSKDKPQEQVNVDDVGDADEEEEEDDDEEEEKTNISREQVSGSRDANTALYSQYWPRTPQLYNSTYSNS